MAGQPYNYILQDYDALGQYQKGVAEKQKAEQEAFKLVQQQQYDQERKTVFDDVLRDPTPQNVFRASQYIDKPDQLKALHQFASTLDNQAKQKVYNQLAPLGHALMSGNYESAIKIAERRASAFAGVDDQASQEARDLAQMIKDNPAHASTTVLSTLGELNPEGVKRLYDVTGELRKQAEERRAAAEATKIKLAPSVQEAIDFKNLPPEDKQVFLSLKTLSRPPAAVTNVNVTNLDKSAATQLGELVPKLHDQANSAAGQIAQLPRYRRALDSAITGPLADTRLTSARVASALGFSGDKAVAATTELMQGLAEMALQSRSMLTGQGQITESEQKLLTKARSGDLNLTKPELQTVFDVADRAARAQYNKSRNLLQSAASKSETAALFLQNVSELPAEEKPQQQGQGLSVTTPDGKMFVFPSKQAADEFKRRAGLQ